MKTPVCDVTPFFNLIVNITGIVLVVFKPLKVVIIVLRYLGCDKREVAEVGGVKTTKIGKT